MIQEYESRRNVPKRKYIQTIHARVEAERNTNSVADGRINFRMQTYMIWDDGGRDNPAAG